MKEITIDCAGIATPRMLHETLAKELLFPDWYGHNLDALHDLLTSIPEDIHLKLLHFAALGNFGNGFHRVLTHAEKSNPHLTVTIL